MEVVQLDKVKIYFFKREVMRKGNWIMGPYLDLVHLLWSRISKEGVDLLSFTKEAKQEKKTFGYLIRA
jgi:hypothetical protein